MIKKTFSYDVVVVGGGVAGMTAAISAARHGAKTALIQNRPVLGGNASSEIRMHICGASKHLDRPNARETGIIEEIQLLNKSRNVSHSWAIFDCCMYEVCAFQDNLDLYLNTNMDDVETDGSVIKKIFATGLMNETKYEFSGKLFIDCTGDATLGFLAGAEYMYGRESKEMFNEPDAPKEAPDNYTMGNTVMFMARDTGAPVKYKKPDWAYTYTEEDLARRNHGDPRSGYWWIELGGKEQSTIYDAEEIRDELLKTVYGIWDHIKNGGDHGMENWELDWVGMLPGKRESRRMTGDYVLTENDLVSATKFDDAVAYGGWSIDCHIIEGFRSGNEEPTKYIHLDDVYGIPYRALYSKNVENLFLGGRAISATNLAFASTRVMGTTAVCGQAVGTAAAIAVKKDITPRGVGEHMKELQQTLLRDDCYIPNFKNEDEKDLARTAKVAASSAKPGTNPADIINGVARVVGEVENRYCSNGISSDGEWVELALQTAKTVSEVTVTFDPDLSEEICISIIDYVKRKQEVGIPTALVKDFDVVFYNGGSEVHKVEIKDNFQRFVKVSANSVMCDKIKIHCHNTNGDKDVKIFEVRIYE